MAKPKSALPLKSLSEEDVKALKSGVEDIEKFKTRAVNANADARATMDRLAKRLEPLGYEKDDIATLIGRRKKERQRVNAKDIRVRKLEVALGMTTADIFDEAVSNLQSATSADEATQASLEAGNAAAKLEAPASDKSPQAPKKEISKSTAAASDADSEKFRAEGRAAFARGATADACKYPANSRGHILWTQGFDDAREEMEKDQAEATNPHNTPSGKPRGKPYLAAVGADL